MIVAVASISAFLREELLPSVTSPYPPLLGTWAHVMWHFPVGLGMLCHFCDTKAGALACSSWSRFAGIWEG